MSAIENIIKKIGDRFTASNSFDDKKHYFFPRFSNYIRPSIYDGNGIWETNDGEHAWVCELAPRIRMGSETAETFEQALTKIPEGFYTQVILFGSKNIEAYLQEYTNIHTLQDSEIVKTSVFNFTNFLRQKTTEKINARFSTQIKNNRVFFVLKNKNLLKLKAVKEDVFNILNSNHFYPTNLEEDALKAIFYEMVNPNHDLRNIQEYNERKFFNKQIMANDNKIFVHKDSVVVDKKYFKALTPIKYPKLAHISEFGMKIGDYISKGLDSNQFVDNYMICLNLTRVGSGEAAAIKRNKQIVKGGANTGNKVKKEKTEIQDIVEGIEERKPVFKMDLNIWVSGKSYEDVKANTDRIKSYWQKKTQKGEEEIGGIILEDFTFALMPLFIGSLPAGINKEYFQLISKSNDENHFVNEVCQFLPLEADYSGNYPNLLFASRRGQICGVDIFNSNYSKNAFIVAQAGAGKSVLANYIAFNEHCRKSRVFIIDIGESYKKICNDIGGEYISIDMNNPISFNPFHGLQITHNEYMQTGAKDTLDEILEQTEFMINFVYMIGANLFSEQAQSEERYIKGVLQDVIANLLDTNPNKILEIHDIQEYLLKSYEDTRLIDFAIHLKPWCKGGAYYKFVSGARNIDLTKPMVVLDLSSVEQRADIRDALIYIMASNIASFIYNNHDFNIQTQVIIDEAHKFLGKNAIMDAFFDQAYRRFRKHNASIIVITQSFEDIYNMKTGGLSIAGQAIMANSPYKFFLNQNDTAINAIKQSGLFTLSELDIELLKSTKSAKGYYSEIFYINPENEISVVRLLIDRYFYYLSTSEPKDKAKIAQIMNKYSMTTSEAIQHIVDNEKQGAAA
ncbi:TraC family protein [Sulfurimonas sp.]|uniref:TraG/VirB4 family ATPase n=1 Tax=Sulfurimonas sp. TaxID=2022749 RepID=UPI0025FF59B1|nr:TraC family protein [Sulfurimonas sp.]MCK9473675.1 TraC family protein [Sulfurimonas sp.]